jgi:hypothetical protein
MARTPIDSQETLTRALAALCDERFGTGFYTYESISSGTQAAVWRGVARIRAHPMIALRLTPKPLELIQRIASVVDSINAVECPQTLGTSSIEVDGRTLTVQVCTWIGSAAFPKSDMYRLGACLAALHAELQASSQDFSDRRLSFERAALPALSDPDQELPSGTSPGTYGGSASWFRYISRRRFYRLNPFTVICIGRTLCRRRAGLGSSISTR